MGGEGGFLAGEGDVGGLGRGQAVIEGVGGDGLLTKFGGRAGGELGVGDGGGGLSGRRHLGFLLGLNVEKGCAREQRREGSPFWFEYIRRGCGDWGERLGGWPIKRCR